MTVTGGDDEDDAGMAPIGAGMNINGAEMKSIGALMAVTAAA